MNSERPMNEQRLALLKTIRKENPSLRRYMNDIINEMENPESAFNTGRVTSSSDMDRQTVMRLCDAFAIAKEYSLKYHLGLEELVEFVSEKTLEIIAENKIKSVRVFQNRIEYLIRQQFPFQNALLSRSGRQNMLSYELADKDRLGGCINADTKYSYEYDSGNPELNIPILFTNNANIAYTEMEHNLEIKMLRGTINKVLTRLTPREKQVIQLRFGLNGEEPQDFWKVGKKLGCTRERIRQVEAKAIRKLSSRQSKSLLKEFIPIEEYLSTPIGRYIQFSGWAKNSRTQYNVRCDCGGKVTFKISYDENQIRQRVLICHRCNKVYKLNTISASTET